MFRPDTILGDMLSGDMVLGPRYVLRFQFLVDVPSWSRMISRVEMDCRSLATLLPLQRNFPKETPSRSQVYFRRFFWVMAHPLRGCSSLVASQELRLSQFLASTLRGGYSVP